MKLTDFATTFQLTVERYQFPNATEYWDANWLLMRGAVAHPDGGWNFLDACMTTFELEKLARWFDSLAASSPNNARCIFTEPNLCFELVADPVPAIALEFSLESAPAWLDRAPVLRFPLVENDPSLVASTLRADLARFPPRGV